MTNLSEEQMTSKLSASLKHWTISDPVWGVDFDLLSDNMRVNLARLKRQTRDRLARWAARLSEFEGYMTILPRSGKKHGNVDALSRMGHPKE